MYNDDLVVITQIITHYFEGLHFADTRKLDKVFSDDCVLKAPGIRRSKLQWFELVKSRPVPAKESAPFSYKILSLDLMGEQAMVKVLVPLLGSHFVDFLGLLKENGRWKVVSKMYIDSKGEKLCPM